MGHVPELPGAVCEGFAEPAASTGRKPSSASARGVAEQAWQSTPSRGFSSRFSRFSDGSQCTDITDFTEGDGLEQQDSCGSGFVMRETNTARRVWDMVIPVMLLYVATVFLYRICFIQFRMPSSASLPGASESSEECGHPRNPESEGACLFFHFLDHVVNVLFWIDLLANFFFSYVDASGVEVADLSLIARRYLQSYFLINLVACIPSELVDAVITSGGGFQRTTRLVQLPRVARLARLVRLTRLLKLANFKVKNKMLRRLQTMRGVRILSQLGSLAFVMHLVACGWYLCAALHEDHAQTWVARRSVDATGNVSLLDRPHFEQWTHSVYFVLTVFTTVGFGDMSAVTTGEIVYVCFTMLVGAVIHSIVISEVINVVQKQDEATVFVETQLELLDAFSAHTEADPNSINGVKEWVASNRASLMKTRYDKEEMKKMFTGKHLPRALLGQISQQLWSGQLAANRLLRCSEASSLTVPPRLPLLLALGMHRNAFEAGEVVYEMNDFPFNMYLVLSGTFAHVAIPSGEGGIDHSGRAVAANFGVVSFLSEKHNQSGGGPTLYPYQLFSHGNYFGDVELLIGGQPRLSTVRCESVHGGVVLMLQKKDLYQVCEEFPRFAKLWRSCALRRRHLRQQLLSKLTAGSSYRDLAATMIQQAWRQGLLRGLRSAARGDGSNSPKSVLLAAPKPTEMERLRGSVEALKQQGEQLQAGMDSLRADFRSLAEELRSALGARVTVS